MNLCDVFESGWRRSAKLRDGVWFERRMTGGRTIAISQPRHGALCRQWFVAISRVSDGVCIDSTHTTHQPNGPRTRSERSAKAWATRWAMDREERLRAALRGTP